MNKRSEEREINKLLEDYKKIQLKIEVVERPTKVIFFIRKCPKCNYIDSGRGKNKPKKCPKCKTQLIIHEVIFNPYQVDKLI